MTMKTTIALLLTTLFTAPLLAADATDEIKAAALKLADQPNYSWSAKTDSATPAGGGQGGGQGGQRGGGRFGGGGSPPEGKTEKGGFTVLTFKMGENTTEAVRKGDKVAIKEGDEWKTAEELSEAAEGAEGGRGNRSQFMVRRVQQVKLPATEAQDWIGRVKAVKKDGDAYVGELTAEAIKEMYTFRGRPGGQGGGGDNAPVTTGLKGTAKFWVKDGVLAKYESHVEGKMTGGRQNRETEVNRKTTVEIKDVGTTMVNVPAEAKKKLNS